MLSIDDADVAARAAAGSVRLLDDSIRKAIRKDVASTIVAEGRRAAGTRARTPLQRALAGTGRASWYKDVPGIAFGGTRSVASSGVAGRTVAHGAEYGSDGKRRTTYQAHSPRGTSYTLTRSSTRQFRPRTADGAFIGDAAEAIAPDVVDTWAALVVAAYVDAVS